MSTHSSANGERNRTPGGGPGICGVASPPLTAQSRVQAHRLVVSLAGLPGLDLHRLIERTRSR